MPTHGRTPSTLHTPHHAIRATNVSAHAPPPSHIDPIYGYQSAHWPKTAVRQLHPNSRQTRSTLSCRSFARPPRSRLHVHCVTCCWYGVVWYAEDGWGLSVRRHSYIRRRHRVELWSMSDYKKTAKTIKAKQSRQLGCTWALSGKKGRNAFWINGRARVVRFLLDFSMHLFLAANGQGIPVFGRCL